MIREAGLCWCGGSHRRARSCPSSRRRERQLPPRRSRMLWMNTDMNEQPTPKPSDHEIIEWILLAMAHQDGEVKFSREGESMKVVFADGVASPVIAFAPN